MLNKENVKDIYPLSPMQEGILFHTLLKEDADAYFQQSSFRVEGSLNTDAMKTALQALVARHDALRTVFKYDRVELPLQIVLKECPAVMAYEDLRNKDTETEVRRLRHQERKRNFDLLKEPQLRLTIAQVADNVYELIWSYHHIMMDGWSMRIVMNEFLQLYQAAINGQRANLPEAQPFSRYIGWLEQQDKTAAGSFWSSYLEAFGEAVPFPGRKRVLLHGSTGYQRQVVKEELDAATTDALRALAGSCQVTLFTLLQSVWGVLLAKLTGSRDVVFGTVIAGRPPELERVEQMVGLFINTIPVRIKTTPQQTFNTLLKTVHTQNLECRHHEHYPLGEILQRSVLKQHLIDHLLVMMDFPEGTATASDLRIRMSDDFEQTSYDLCVDIAAGKQLSVNFTYNAAAFENTFVDRVSRMFIQLLQQIIKTPDIPLSRLSVFTPADEQMLNRFNNTDTPLLTTDSITRILESHAAEIPDHIAVVYRDKQISYEALNTAASQLAGYMQRNGEINRDDRIGILMERSDHMLVSMLAIWKCGAAYIPLDVTYPPARITGMLEDAEAVMVLTDQSFQHPGLRNSLSQQYVLIDLDEEAGDMSGDNMPVEIHPGDLAYIIYTSGSTGKPKGAMVEHTGMMNHLFAKIKDLHLTRDAVIVQNASHCFDISVWQWLAALITGGRTVVYDREMVLDPAAFIQQVAADRVTILELVPSYLSILLGMMEEQQDIPALTTLQFLVMTGETLKPSLVNRWFMMYAGIPMVNAYGPTEASDDITHYLISGPIQRDIVPVGYPVQNMRIYIVNEDMQLCPIGVKGEVMVSGIGVGRGYINDAAKTAAAFLTDPFRNGEPVKMYRTGDTGRMLEDGAVEFFGRKDHQVKIRGFRIELEEIEATITCSPFVRNAVVLDKVAADGDVQLSAFLEVNDGYDTDTLRVFLGERLADYMIPARFTVVDAFPVTSSGKTDRKTIREMPETVTESNTATYKPPRNETEQKLVEIWQEVLSVERIGITDNFFDLGGDSFKAIRVVSRYGKGFLVPDLYRNLTIEKLSAFIAQKGQGDDNHFLYALTPAVGHKSVSIIGVPNSAGDPLIYEETTKAMMELTADIAFYGVNLPRTAPGEGESMQSQLVELAANIVAEIKKRINTPVLIYGQCNGIGLALELARQLQEADMECVAVCAGGILPRTKIVAEGDKRSDEELLTFLTEIDATFPRNIEDQLIFFRNLKYDGILAKASFNHLLGLKKENRYRLLKAPFYMITGDRDPIAKGYRTKYRDWQLFAEKVSLVEVAGVGHFMWRDKPAELADILHRIAHGNYVAEPAKKSKWSLFK